MASFKKSNFTADVRIFNPLAPTNCSVSLDDALKRHEQEKKRCYNERVLEVEQASFCPLVFSVTGAMGNEAEKFYRHLTHRLSKKTHQTYPHTMRYIRQRISFTLLRTAVISLRGHKGTKLKAYSKDTNDFNLLYMWLIYCDSACAHLFQFKLRALSINILSYGSTLPLKKSTCQAKAKTSLMWEWFILTQPHKSYLSTLPAALYKYHEHRKKWIHMRRIQKVVHLPLWSCRLRDFSPS